jgi:hypothetical protein
MSIRMISFGSWKALTTSFISRLTVSINELGARLKGELFDGNNQLTNTTAEEYCHYIMQRKAVMHDVLSREICSAKSRLEYRIEINRMKHLIPDPVSAQSSLNLSVKDGHLLSTTRSKVCLFTSTGKYEAAQ